MKRGNADCSSPVSARIGSRWDAWETPMELQISAGYAVTNEICLPVSRLGELAFQKPDISPILIL